MANNKMLIDFNHRYISSYFKYTATYNQGYINLYSA